MSNMPLLTAAGWRPVLCAAAAHLWHLCPCLCLCVFYDCVALQCKQPLDYLLVGIIWGPACIADLQESA
jgi:hypothetical protein